jgi:hypothetical protein
MAHAGLTRNGNETTRAYYGVTKRFSLCGVFSYATAFTWHGDGWMALYPHIPFSGQRRIFLSFGNEMKCMCMWNEWWQKYRAFDSFSRLTTSSCDESRRNIRD